jgi:hypothetical protein
MLPSSNCCVSVVLLPVLRGCDIWSLILREEHRQRVFENKVQREISYDIFVNCNWVATWWQLYSTHLHTNNTQNGKKQIYIEKHKNWEQHKNFGRVRAVSRLGELYPGICLTSEEKARKNLSQGSRTIRMHKPNNKNTQITVLNRNKTIYW